MFRTSFNSFNLAVTRAFYKTRMQCKTRTLPNLAEIRKLFTIISVKYFYERNVSIIKFIV